MIVEMKKITLLCLDSAKNRALESLRDLGIMHVSANLNIDSRDVASAALELDRINAVLRDLSSRKVSAAKDPKDAHALYDRAKTLLDESAAYAKELDTLRKDEIRLEPWGDFSFVQIEKLRESGVYVTLCTAPPGFHPAEAEGILCKTVNESKFESFFAVISREKEVVPEGMALFVPPERTLGEILTRKKELFKEETARQKELSSIARYCHVLEEYRASLAEKHEFLMNRDNMKISGLLAYIVGYVPCDALEALRSTARKEGWGLLIEDPAPDDNQVPTFIRKPKWLDIMDPLFDFIGVSPGYRENDVNVFFLIFFPVFFGMIIGDAVYGCLFLGCAVAGKILLRNRPAAKLPLNLFILLSCCSIGWGWLNGSWAGIPAHALPDWMRGWAFLSDPAQSPLAVELAKKLAIIKPSTGTDAYAKVFEEASWNGKIVQWLCFFLAAIHLSSARLFKFASEIATNWRALGHLGWTMLIVANFFMAVNLIVFSGTFPQWGYYLYGAGALLVIATVTFEEALNLPFAFIGSFTDVLSYIRLYAVGLAGSLIAIKFNEMGLMMTDGKSGAVFYLAVIALILIALFGHLLNIALGFLSVMVHGIRLNTLEFSNHIGMQWAGIKYHPFRKEK